MFIATSTSLIIGTESLMSSGVSSRCALYSGKASCRNVFPWSKATPICVGFSLFSTSLSVLQKPITADVFSPLELILGARMNA